MKKQKFSTYFENWLYGKDSYYTYTGSLTTPSCREGVRCLYLKLSADQVSNFSKALGHNNRPVQETNAKNILEYKHKIYLLHTSN